MGKKSKKPILSASSETKSETSTTAVTPTVASPDSDDIPSSAPPLSATEPPPTPVNLSNLAELKLACDDCVKQYFTRTTEFTQSHVHTDVRLLLGWSASLIAFASAYYGYIVPFEESKLWVTVGVVLYIILSALQWIYAQYVEKTQIFVGKRRTVSSRISTERLTLSSHIPPSPTASSGFFSSSPPPSASKPPPPFPSYTLQLSYVHSSNNGKALLHKSEATLTKGFGEMFDTKGVLQKEKLEEALEDRWKGVVGA